MKALLSLMVLVTIGFATSCAGSEGSDDVRSSSPASHQTGSTVRPLAASTEDLLFCVNETNRYRALAGKPPVKRSIALEAFAAEGARMDGMKRIAHSHFDANRGRRIAFAENEVPWWPFARDGSVEVVMRESIARFWAEGPGGSHYRNLTGAYTEVGCGVSVNNGEITIVQDFR